MMVGEERSTYGTTVAKPDEKAGVEVGGGEKFAALQKKKEDASRRSDDRSEKQSDKPSGEARRTPHE